MTAIELHSVNYSYGKRQALIDLSFSVQTGTMTALLGPNGGGKTTAFRILSTLIVPDTGTVLVEGHNAVEKPFEVRRKTGIVFQSNSLDYELSAFENLIHQGHLHGLRGTELRNRVNHLLELQRQQGITILLTTHSLDEAEKCNQLVIIDEGKLVAEGSPDRLKKDVGDEVVVVHTTDALSLADSIRSDLGLDVEAIDGLLRIERSDGHLLIGRLVEKYGNRIDSVTVSKPTLDDVFIHKTGHSFESSSDQP